MKRAWIILVLLAISSTAFGQSEQAADKAGNLFQGNTYKNPYTDHVARNVGDILTVIISETTNASNSASTSLSKADTNSIKNGIPVLQGLFGLASNSVSSSNAGSGTTSNSGSLTTQMSVKVIKVLPNGVLQIEGTRSIRTNKNVQSFVLTGEVRPEDVLSNNTILSSSIEDAKIELDDKGSIAVRQRRGILTRLLDWLF